jgi:DivIVA domain-containing protein
MIYRVGQRILPYQIRTKVFTRRRRGLDPQEVYAFLDQVADELDRVLQDGYIAHTEAERIRQGLRQWQTRHAHCHQSQTQQRAAHTTNHNPW